MITRVKLQNWRSHEDTDFTFGKGTNVLVGVMGSGKSSLLDAISFALFGTFPALQSRKLKLDECIMNKPLQKERASVEVTFNLDGHERTVYREITLGKGSKRAEVRETGRLVEGPAPERVNELLDHVLRVDYELFARAVYSEQNQIDYFLEIPAGSRRRKIDELLRIDKYETARKNLTAFSNRLRDRKEGLMEELSRVRADESLKRLPTLEKELEQLKKESASDVDLLAAAKRDLSQAESRLAELEQRQKSVRQLENTLVENAGWMKSLEQAILETRKVLGDALDADAKAEEARLAEKKKHAEAKLRSLAEERERKHADDLSKQLARLSAEAEEMRARTAKRKDAELELARLGSDWDARLAEARQASGRLESIIKEHEAALKNEKKRLDELRASDSRCPVCNNELAGHKKEELERHARTAIENANRAAADAREKLARLKIDELEANARKAALLRERLAGLDVSKAEAVEREAAKLAAEHRAAAEKAGKEKTELDSLRREVDDLSQKLFEVRAIAEKQAGYAQAVASLEKAVKRADELKREIAAKAFSEEELARQRGRKEELASAKSRLETKASLDKRLIGEKEETLKQVRSKAELAEALEQDGKKLGAAVESLALFGSALESTQSQLREEFTQAINAGLDDVWARLYPYGDYTSLRLGIDTGDYTLQARRRDGTWIDVEGAASGGERSTAALALRIAFALVLTRNLSWLVLDEPTHNLDRQGVARLAKALREHMPQFVDQIFVITHDEELESAVSSTLYRLERDKARDEPTRAVLVTSGTAQAL